MDGSVILVAPFSPIGSCEHPHLGAAKKISFVLQMLIRFNRPVVFINSAHNQLSYSRTRFDHKEIGGKPPFTTITPFTLRNRRLGKLLNLFGTKSLARQLATQKPVMVWIYNGYAFEAKLASELNEICGCPIVLELEDWHTARSRGLNPKPAFDLYYFKKVMRRATLVTCVNEATRQRTGLPSSRTMLLPSIVDKRLILRAGGRVPFAQQPYRLGYFGGLTDEKGADIVLALANCLPSNWQLVVTGSGPLADSFSTIAANGLGQLHFINNATEDELYREMLGCDAIVNPHQSIATMGDGIFPFKVFEALASDRLLISTLLPQSGLPLDDIIMFYDGSVAKLSACLEHAQHFYESRLPNILRVGDKVRLLYSEDAIFSEFNQRMTQHAFEL
jgi:glycosyltransferase involved in cell wall biosynthesis